MASKMPRFLSTSVVYLLIAVVALLFRGTVPETTLYEDYEELCKIIPFDEIIETIRHYNETDDEVKDFLKRLEDPDIKKYALWLYKQPPLHEALEFLEEHDVPGYEVMSKLMTPLGWPPLLRPEKDEEEEEWEKGGKHRDRRSVYKMAQEKFQHRRERRSVHKMAQDVRTQVPPLALFQFYSKKMKTSQEFREFVEILQSDEFNDMVLEAMEHKGYKKFTHILEDGGLDVDSLRRSLCTMFSWGHREKKKHAGGLFSKFFSTFFH